MVVLRAAAAAEVALSSTASADLGVVLHREVVGRQEAGHHHPMTTYAGFNATRSQAGLPGLRFSQLRAEQAQME